MTPRSSGRASTAREMIARSRGLIRSPPLFENSSSRPDGSYRIGLSARPRRSAVCCAMRTNPSRLPPPIFSATATAASFADTIIIECSRWSSCQTCPAFTLILRAGMLSASGLIGIPALGSRRLTAISAVSSLIVLAGGRGVRSSCWASTAPVSAPTSEATSAANTAMAGPIRRVIPADPNEPVPPGGRPPTMLGSAAFAAVERWPDSGATVAVAAKGGVLASHGDLDAVVPLASVTKALVALAVLVAVEEGTVGLDEPAGPLGSTIRHLLAHASGLPFEGTTPIAAPGTRRIYSNTGFEILAGEVAHGAGMPMARYLHEAVVEPLGLRATALLGSPASGAASCARDLAAVASELLTPALIDPSTLAVATRVVFPGLAGILPGFGQQRDNDWGLGFEIRDAKSPHWTGTANSPATFGHYGQSG